MDATEAQMQANLPIKQKWLALFITFALYENNLIDSTNILIYLFKD
jgi:hypothetical protein